MHSQLYDAPRPVAYEVLKVCTVYRDLSFIAVY